VFAVARLLPVIIFGVLKYGEEWFLKSCQMANEALKK
jgi:hypothetical protein